MGRKNKVRNVLQEPLCSRYRCRWLRRCPRGKGYESSIKASPLDCKFGSGDILGKCGKCAQAITECASAPNKTKNVTCIKEIGSFAGDCGGCSVNILECL